MIEADDFIDQLSADSDPVAAGVNAALAAEAVGSGASSEYKSAPPMDSIHVWDEADVCVWGGEANSSAIWKRIFSMTSTSSSLGSCCV